LKRPSTHDGPLQLVKRCHLAIHRRRAARLARHAHRDQCSGHFFSQVFDGSLPGPLDPGGLGAWHRHPHDLHRRLDADLPGPERLRHARQLFEPQRQRPPRQQRRPRQAQSFARILRFARVPQPAPAISPVKLQDEPRQLELMPRQQARQPAQHTIQVMTARALQSGQAERRRFHHGATHEVCRLRVGIPAAPQHRVSKVLLAPRLGRGSPAPELLQPALLGRVHPTPPIEIQRARRQRRQ
jgi:hypothetical protein